MVPVRIVCAEPERPYDRPPLSKELLGGRAGAESPAFRPADWYADEAVELIDGRAAALDPAAGRVELDDGSRLGYERLLIATGAAPRRLQQFSGFENALSLRTLADARRLRSMLSPGARLVVVGAGFIGQEVAATALGLGAEVTIVEALELPLASLLGERIGRWIVDLHRNEGARVLLSARIAGASGNGRVERIELEGGERLDCDVVVVGIGVVPAAAWLERSGLDPAGVPTDRGARTVLPDIWAAGDVARPWDTLAGAHVRSEHWDAASRQGVAAALSMLGAPPAEPAPPSFWSDQHGLRIQYVGRAECADRASFSGDLPARDFCVTYTRGGRPVAGLAVGRPRELAAIRKLIGHPARPEHEDEEAMG